MTIQAALDAFIADADAATFRTLINALRTNHVAKTADAALLATDSGVRFSNVGATGTVILDLPAASGSGIELTFIVGAAQTLTARATSNDTIRIAGSASSTNGTASSNTVGNALTLISVDTARWIALSHEGTWTLA